MSGGIGPCSDIHLPKEESAAVTDQKPAVSKEAEKAQPQPRRRGFFTLRQLNMLAVMIVLSASGMVSMEDLGFVVLSVIYMYFISMVAFPQTTPPWTGSVFGQSNRSLRLYMFTAAVVGLFLPIAYIFEGKLVSNWQGY